MMNEITLYILEKNAKEKYNKDYIDSGDFKTNKNKKSVAIRHGLYGSVIGGLSGGKKGLFVGGVTGGLAGLGLGHIFDKLDQKNRKSSMNLYLNNRQKRKDYERERDSEGNKKSE